MGYHKANPVSNDLSSESQTSDSYAYPRKNSDQANTGWPLVVYFILFVEFCERFCYYGFRSILGLYFKEYFGFSEDVASQIFHIFGALVYIFPIAGAIISDSYWGRFKTIWRFSCVYLLGLVFLVASAIPTFLLQSSGEERTIHLYLAITGLFLIAAGTGGIKPCVSAFGADQFGVHQAQAKENYFKYFYFLINLGAMISSWLTPELKGLNCYSSNATSPHIQDVFSGDSEVNKNRRLAFDSCHMLSYLVPAILMFVALMTFLTPPLVYWCFKNSHYDIADGFRYTLESKSETNVIWNFCTTVASGVRGSIIKSSDDVPVNRLKSEEGFLRYSDEKMGQTRRSTYRLLQIGLLFLPIIFFSAVIDQLGTIWTFQVSELNGWLGGWYVKADQVESLNSLFVITMIPLWTICGAPVIRKVYYGRTAKRTKTIAWFLNIACFPK
jgi:solute carrier family 15 oligopeptide transporter 1